MRLLAFGLAAMWLFIGIGNIVVGSPWVGDIEHWTWYNVAPGVLCIALALFFVVIAQDD